MALETGTTKGNLWEFLIDKHNPQLVVFVKHKTLQEKILTK